MGVCNHLGLAFDPKDEAKAIAMLNGEGDEGGNDCIRYQLQIDLEREVYYDVHRVLEVLAEDSPELAALGTIVIGSRYVADAGNGMVYFYSVETVGAMAEAYRRVTPDELALAVKKVRSEEPQRCPHASPEYPAYLAEKFAMIRDELSLVADNGWAVIAGMF